MGKHLLSVLYIGLLSTSFSPTLNAQGIVATHTSDGRIIYENAPENAGANSATAASRESGLVYWSNVEHRWKPVPPMNSNSMRAARSAAADVRRQLRYAARTNSRFAVEGNSLRIASEQTQNPSTASVHGTANLNAGFAAPSPAFAPSFRSYSSAVPTESEWIEKIVQQAALQHDVDANLVRAIIKVESNFNPRAVSRKGAIGLMQLMPGTAKSLNVTNPYDPAQNVDAGVRHFKELLESYDGNLELSLAAYNAGVGAVHRSRGIPNYSETRKYVRRITGIYGSKTARLNTSSHPLVLRRDAEGHLSVSDME